MSDKLYEEFNNISFDEAEFDLIEDALTDVEMKTLKNNLKKRIYKKKRRHIKTAASIVITAIVGVTLITPTFAEAVGQYIPAMEAVYEKLGYYQEYKEFSQYIGESKEDEGYTFTIDRLVADSDTVLIGVKVSKPGLNAVKKDIRKKSDFMMTADLIGGKEGTIMSGGIFEEVLDENTSIVMVECDTAPGKELPKRFAMMVNIHNMFESSLNVNFDLPVSREKIQKETIIKKNLGESNIGDGFKINLKELKVSPINTSIKYSYEGESTQEKWINFYAYDDKGRIYDYSSGRADDSGYRINVLEKINKEAKKLYIIPYMQIINEGEFDNEKYEDLDFNNTFFKIDTIREFDFKDEGIVNLYKIEKNSKSIKFYYNIIKGEGELDKGYRIWLFENNGDRIEDKKVVAMKNAKIYKLFTSEDNSYCLE
ncbi:DUF4179 domain-containing protein [Clostridium cellulovorans]|uniref:DUF4179 domain-containing protein n=1 Tax=Clostridium cellulovorans (strain ATCC 35296 / DSM 3052 / OCM 3 / 743B) TaxID=573061 RepID=D9SRN7_CLOC7|nr:DUF4179 domain-containing protein [Clostridium cellulovorans]ADL50404.1 hypothetical protein Clocel_0633 [Clostridium cellulovorans 743B]